ncbi:disulfide bond formation protein B [Roseovarius albus]|uniref:Disulfide bond formation protein B n=1 Tax=Roseovarius albus TaxID=1247867 RepID=A0A1X6ZT33_9RHOB|nr:disulfide bond formation protein B [Roseovarius albus]SLN60830.1 disulfide bond formation protein B [Roseovarius albus]
MTMSLETSRTLNALGMLAVSLVLIGAYFYQFLLYELPCPLCLLQRVGFVAVGFGLGLNLLYGPRPRHYALVLIAAISGGCVSIRQILLHIVPGTGHYGSPVMGLHYYTWAGICFFLIILGTSIMMLSENQYEKDDVLSHSERFGGSSLAKFAFILMLFLGIANAVSTLLECGPGICDDPPTDYKFLDELEKSE